MIICHCPHCGAQAARPLTRAQEDALRDLIRLADAGEVKSNIALYRQVAEMGPHSLQDVIAASRWWRRPLNWE